MKGLDKNKLIAIGAVLAVVIAVIVFAVGLGSGGNDSDSSQPALTVFSASDTSAAETTAPAAESAAESAADTELTTTATTTAAAEAPKEYTEYSFRSKKLFDDHYKKHGAEFGDITQEEYLQLANDMLNSDSDTILHKTEAEDGDDVFFDTDTGYFLVLSTDGYIRTFFIPKAGIDYFDRQ